MKRYYLKRISSEEGPYTSLEIEGLVYSGWIDNRSLIRREDGAWFPAGTLDHLFSTRTWRSTLALAIFLGWFGIDRISLGYAGMGMMKILTCGGFGLWWVIDCILILMGKLPDSQGRPLKR